MPPPLKGLVAGFSDDNPMIAPFADAHPQIEKRLDGKRQALEALGVYHLVADRRVPGQLARETAPCRRSSSRTMARVNIVRMSCNGTAIAAGAVTAACLPVSQSAQRCSAALRGSIRVSRR